MWRWRWWGGYEGYRFDAGDGRQALKKELVGPKEVSEGRRKRGGKAHFLIRRNLGSSGFSTWAAAVRSFATIFCFSIRWPY
jgi:hypothetical protein